MTNYRTSLRNMSPELIVNLLKRRQGHECPGPNQVKKPRKAEVNFLPDYTAGENKENLEKERLELLTEVMKSNNQQVIRHKMGKTFALRREEVVQDLPFIVDFKGRWPALFSEREICAEFTRITTIPLVSKFMAKLDAICPKLSTVYCMKGGAAGRKVKEIMAATEQCRHTEGMQHKSPSCVLE